MNNHRPTIHRICEKLEHKKYVMHWCFCNYYDLILLEDPVWGNAAPISLLGWLKSKEVLIGIFGEESMCDKCNGVRCIYHDEEIPRYQYHSNNMDYTLEEVLKYYEEYLK